MSQSNFLNLSWQGLSKASTHPVAFHKLEWGQPDPAQPDPGAPQWFVFLGIELQRLSQHSAFCYLLTNYLCLLLAGAGGTVWLHSPSASPPALSLQAAQSSPKTRYPCKEIFGEFKTTQELPQSHCQQLLVVTHPEALTSTKIQSGGDTGTQDTPHQYPYRAPSNTARSKPPPITCGAPKMRAVNPTTTPQAP